MKKKAKKNTVAKSTKSTATTQTSNGRGRPKGSGNYVITLKDLVGKLGEDAKVPVIKSYLDAVGLKGKPFTTNKGSIADLTRKYTQTPGTGAVRKVNLQEQAS